jgi:hypothetical protein
VTYTGLAPAPTTSRCAIDLAGNLDPTPAARTDGRGRAATASRPLMRAHERRFRLVAPQARAFPARPLSNATVACRKDSVTTALQRFPGPLRLDPP